MPVSLEDFCRQISELSLLSESELTSARSTIKSAPSNEATKEFARKLVRQKKMTAFQAQQLYNGNGSTLMLGNYLVLEKIGQGGMGMVFKSLHRRMDRLVAVKVLPPTMVKTASSIQRFQREVRAVAKLDHPNIVAAYDADESDGTHFLVMQYVDGKDLAAKVREDGRLPIMTALDYIQQAATGLAYAHGKNVIHRDIKPANLLLGGDDVVRILDLGLARIQSDASNLDDQLTQSGHIMGTVDYMAPEQALDTRNADERADIYSLGATFWYLVTAESLYPGDSFVQKLVAHQNAPLRSLSELRPDATAEIEAWLGRMVAKSPNERFQSMEEVIVSLADFAKHANIHCDSAIHPGSSASKRDGQKKATTVANVERSQVDTDAQSIGPLHIKTSTDIRTAPVTAISVTRAKPNKDSLLRRYWWLAGSVFPVLAVAAIVVIIRSDDGTETRIEVSEGSKVEMIETSSSRPATLPVPIQAKATPASLEPAAQPVLGSLPSVSQPGPPETRVTTWEYLFNGTQTAAWSTLGSFRVQDDLLIADGGHENAISMQEYSDFELEAVWKIGPGANGGIYYRNHPDRNVATGNEYQIADHKSNPVDYPPEKQSGSLYGLLAPTKDVMQPPGQWNTTRIVCQGTRVEHWLNQRKVLEYDTSGDEFRFLKEASAFTGKEVVGKQVKNFLLLQRISGTIAFQSIRVRRLATKVTDLLAGPGVPEERSANAQWRFNYGILTGKGTARSSKSGWCWCNFDQKITGDFDFEISLRSKAISPFQLSVPLGNEQALTVSLSYNVSGLIFVDGVDIGTNPNSEFPFQSNDALLKNDAWQLLCGKVRHHGDELSVELTLDDVLIANFNGSRTRIGHAQWGKPDPVHFKFSGYGDLSNVEVQFRRAVVVNVLPEKLVPFR